MVSMLYSDQLSYNICGTFVIFIACKNIKLKYEKLKSQEYII